MLLPMALLTACSSTTNDEPEAGQTGTEPLSRSVTIYTRVPDGRAEEWELIRSWWVAFVDRNDNVVRVVSSPVDQGPILAETVTTTLKMPAGNYTVYAFANFSAADPSAILMNIKEGTVLPEDFEERVWTIVPSYDNHDVVPMSGKLYNVVVHPRESENIVVEVVRMVAKMRMKYSTETRYPLNVKRVTIANAHNDGVAFFPNYGTLGGQYVSPDILPSSTLTDLVRDYGSGLMLTAADPEATTDVFYALESSAASHPTGRYVLAFDVVDTHTGSSRTITALAYQLPFINRNDFVTIPVRFTDRNVEFGVRFYPPIGGYPAWVMEEKGDEFYATFGSAGAFVIIPRVTDYDGNVYPASSYTLDVELVSDPAGILAGVPERDDDSYEIVGELRAGTDERPAVGTAELNLTFHIVVEGEGTEQNLEYAMLRKLFIIRK